MALTLSFKILPKIEHDTSRITFHEHILPKTLQSQPFMVKIGSFQKLDRVRLVYNKPSMDSLHHFVQKKKKKKREEKKWHTTNLFLIIHFSFIWWATLLTNSSYPLNLISSITKILNNCENYLTFFFNQIKKNRHNNIRRCSINI